jgi:quinone-modifying oxidoreductase subunit QmoB
VECPFGAINEDAQRYPVFNESRCRRDDDYQCHFVRGSRMAAERLSRVGETLQQLNLETERVQVFEVAITDIKRAPRLINDMAATIEKIGMSPFKF